MTAELAKPKEKVLEDVRVDRVWNRQEQLLPQLTQIYFETWAAEGLCASYEEAAVKMAAFNPADTYVVISEAGEVYALVQTLPVHLPSLAYLPHRFPTYTSVEVASRAAERDAHPNFVICFSINARPGFKIKAAEDKNISLARFLLTNLPTPPDCHKVAYSRFCNYAGGSLLDFYLSNLGSPKKLGAAGMHENLGGITAAIIENSRPEDSRGGGANVIVTYPNTPEEAILFSQIKANRADHPPTVIKYADGHVYFADVPTPYYDSISPGLDITTIGVDKT